MPYVERNQAGDVTGWARRPTSHATEFLAEDHPDMASFRGRPNVPTDSQLLADIVGDVLDDVLGQLAAAIAANEVTATPKMTALLAKRAKIKGDIPRPAAASAGASPR